MKLWIMFFILFLPVLANADATHSESSMVKAFTLSPASDVAEGKNLFDENGCALCHGTNGNGEGPMAGNLKVKPRNFADYDNMKRMPEIRMEQAIREGTKGSAMPSFAHLDENQIHALIAYIKSFISDSYTDLDVCIFETAIMKTGKLPKGAKFEVDEPDRMELNQKGEALHISLKDWDNYLDKPKWRTHLRVINGDRILSVVTLKYKPCRKHIRKLLRSLPCHGDHNH